MRVQSFLLDPSSVWSALLTQSHHARGRARIVRDNSASEPLGRRHLDLWPNTPRWMWRNDQDGWVAPPDLAALLRFFQKDFEDIFSKGLSVRAP